jgi:threonine dehydrogenase-like Zn-dependent dehydrogenase
MRAAVTQAVGAMELLDLPEPDEPGPGEVVVRPEAVGICGSDFHFFAGHLSDAAGGSQFPRIQGHEVGAVVEAVGPDCREELVPGARVAMHPLVHCGRCYPCRIGRHNTCDNFSLFGIHDDGGLQELLRLPDAQVFAIDAPSGAVAALVEPVSIAVRAVRRGNIQEGEHVVVLGAGPIGQSVLVAARDRGAEVMVVDLVESRLALSRQLGAETLVWTGADDVVTRAREWSGGEGPPVVVDATGVAGAVRAAVDMVASAGRVVQVGMSNEEAPLRIGSFTEKELDMLGVTCCGTGEFVEAVDLVERHADALAAMVTHEFPLERAPEALVYAMENPTEVMKVVILGAGAD